MPTLKKQRNKRGREIRKATGIPFGIAHRIAKLELSHKKHLIVEKFPEYAYIALMCDDAECCGTDVKISKEASKKVGGSFLSYIGYHFAPYNLRMKC